MVAATGAEGRWKPAGVEKSGGTLRLDGALCRRCSSSGGSRGTSSCEGPPDTSEDNAPVVWKEFKIPEDDTDRIPDWMSDASGTSDVGDDGGSDGSNDGDSDSDSDGG